MLNARSSSSNCMKFASIAFAQLPTFLYPLQGALYITKHRVLYNRVGSNLGQYILYAIPTLLLIYIG